MTELQTLESELSERYGAHWDAWRTATGEWFVRGQLGADLFGISDPCLLRAMRTVRDHVFLRKIPRPPKVFSANLFKAVKRDGKWQLDYDGDCFYINAKTKRAAEQTIQQWCERSQYSQAKWEAEFGWSCSKVEGVDFRYQE